MSDDEGSGDDRRKKREDPMPEYKMRFTDMQKELVEKAIRLIHRVHQGKKMDKDAALAIHKELNSHPELLDEQAGWHVIVGKSYASAVTYNTKNMLFFDLLGDVNKSFLIFKTQWLCKFMWDTTNNLY